MIDVGFGRMAGPGVVSRAIKVIKESSKLFTNDLFTPGNMLPIFTFSNNTHKVWTMCDVEGTRMVTHRTTLKCAENHGKSVFHASNTRFGKEKVWKRHFTALERCEDVTLVV